MSVARFMRSWRPRRRDDGTPPAEARTVEGSQGGSRDGGPLAATHSMYGYFRDRRDAGQQLATQLDAPPDPGAVIVLALPRGGVPVAYEVARTLAAPLDVFLVRKLGAPGREELALGAIASGGVRVLNDEVIAGLAVAASVVDAVTTRETVELQRRERLYREGRPPLRLEGRHIILVDDGVATGASAGAAIAALRQHAVKAITFAVPVGPQSTITWLAAQVDEMVCLLMPEPFFAVGTWYRDFGETTDEQVRQLLAGSPAAE